MQSGNDYEMVAVVISDTHTYIYIYYIIYIICIIYYIYYIYYIYILTPRSTVQFSRKRWHIQATWILREWFKGSINIKELAICVVYFDPNIMIL